MNAETLEKAQSLQRQISDYETDLKELENGCGIFVDKQGKVSIKTEREWLSRTAPDWFAQKINEALYEYRSAIVSTRENLKTQLENL